MASGVTVARHERQQWMTYVVCRIIRDNVGSLEDLLNDNDISRFVSFSLFPLDLGTTISERAEGIQRTVRTLTHRFRFVFDEPFRGVSNYPLPLPVVGSNHWSINWSINWSIRV